MLKIISLNVNGIRASARKGLFQWLQAQQADVVCLQEIKTPRTELTDALFFPLGYHAYFNPALKPGYSGVALYSRVKPLQVSKTFGWPLAEEEGRYLAADFGSYQVISLYLPSGSSGEHRQAIKYEFMQQFLPHLKQLAQSKKPTIIAGDWNIAHKTIDIKNWRANQQHSGFLPDERAWLDRVLYEYDWVDAFRAVNQQAEQYTWWSNRGRARENNVGWRIDYQIVSSELKNKIQKVSIETAQQFSDHASLIVEYDQI
jgi:exodeoxyribonuclease-3